VHPLAASFGHPGFHLDARSIYPRNTTVQSERPSGVISVGAKQAFVGLIL
jgi:hypothetical protein